MDSREFPSVPGVRQIENFACHEDEDSGPVAFIDRLWAGCTDGFIELDPATQYDGVAGKTPKGEFNFPPVFQQKVQVDDFARCVRENKESIVSGEDGLKDMLILDAIHKSIASGKKEKVGIVK